MFAGIRPAVVALIAVPTFSLAKSAHITFANCWIPILSAHAYLASARQPHLGHHFPQPAAGYIYGKFILPTE